MNLTIPKPTVIDAAFIRCVIPLRYENEEDSAHSIDFPGRNGDVITLDLNLDTGKIFQWPIGRVGDLTSVKVCDEGVYILIDRDGFPLAKIESYVPDCIPNEYGDYIKFDIQADGSLKGWKPDPNKVFNCFFGNNDE